MSEPAIFALIRNGETHYYADRWASALLRREVLWGPEDFEAWVTQFEQLDEWDEDCDGGAVVDFDKRSMLWSGDTSNYGIPRIWQTYCQLMTAAWPGFDVKVSANGAEALAEYLGLPRNEEDPEDALEDDEDEEEYEPRPLTVEDAGADDDGEDIDEDDEPDKDAPYPRAWVTLIDEEGSTRQRQLDELPIDLLKGQVEALQAVAKLRPAEIPKEAHVSEGLIINPKKKTARIWGSPELLTKMKQLGGQWKGWQLKWTHHGYSDQCAVCNTPGQPMTEVDVLAKILPVVISTEQFSLGTVFGVIGGGMKKFAKKATGCLGVVLCIPLVLFGVFSGNWTAVLYAIGATAVVVVGLYMFVARKFRKAVTKNMPAQDNDETSTAVAGPQEEEARKARIDQLLAAAKLPPLAEIEPHFPDVSGLELLAT
ncbi:MAG: hypothetical protein GXP24_13520 [Planctomycetes bacterium]|nr:hypothetical protein [Planctomycetota bacterium]